MSITPFATLNIGGRLLELKEPLVMGILNATPDSFYAESRKQTDRNVLEHVGNMLSEGAHIIDVGACSTRPGAEAVSESEELTRIEWALGIIRKEFPEAVLSVDTYRSAVARCCVEKYGVQLINDISGGELDSQMFCTMAELGIPYVLSHWKAQAPTDNVHYDNLMCELLFYFGRKVQELHEIGVKDIILDPGFGFCKNLSHNYELLRRLQELHTLNLPLLVGMSRKRMVHQLLGCTPQEALNGTTVLHTIALQKGVHILRVHDVKEALEAIKIVRALQAKSEIG